ncbi:hypothetical protein FCIRC_9543 [Fusarium circinatum]|uniref:Uncharacterized protein n=1 Tax=Fusarium circinatum TaxID=48490 RepID=A0A8H5THQ6_FUSCI|nr:hypothetical protein FCIRC_9543 [Fusarium circinatum]
MVDTDADASLEVPVPDAMSWPGLAWYGHVMTATDSAGGGREGLNKRATQRLEEGEKAHPLEVAGMRNSLGNENQAVGTGASERVGSRHGGPNPPSQSSLALDSLQPASASASGRASARAATFDLSWDSYSSV